MAVSYTEEKLNSLDKKTIIQLFLSQQEQLEKIDHAPQLVLEQMADLKRHRFGRSTERHDADGQISFMEKDGEIVFLTNQRLLLLRKLGRNRKPCRVGGRRKNRGNGKRIWKGCRSL